MKRIYLEEVFDYKGYKCACVFNAGGYRCGYVAVDESHPYYKMDYTDDGPNEVMCHWGLTYSGEGRHFYDDFDDLWWFGFDCGHCYDSNDYDLAIEYFPHLKEHLLWTKEIEGRYPIGKEIRTLEYVEKECKKLAEQLKIYDDNKSKGCEE